MNQRALQRFDSTIHSEQTRKNYKRDLDSFIKFHGIKDYDSILSIPSEQAQEMIEDYLVHLKKTKPNSATAYIWGIKHFFVVNRLKLDWEIIQKMLPPREVKSGYKAWTTKHIQKILSYSKTKRNRALIHFLASTGSRIGVFDHDLTMKHLFDVGHGCKGVTLYAGFKEEYFSFLTPEALASLDEYHEERKRNGEIFDEDTPIFRLTYQLGSTPAKPMNSMCAKAITNRIVKSSGIQRKKIGFSSEIQINHGFRKRFNTILKMAKVNWSVAEKLMGHKNGLDNIYFKPTTEEVFTEFRKAIPELSIDDSIRYEEELKNKDDQIKELEVKDQEIEKLKAQVGSIERLIERIVIAPDNNNSNC